MLLEAFLNNISFDHDIMVQSAIGSKGIKTLRRTVCVTEDL